MLDIQNTALAVIDVQGKLTSIMADHQKVLAHIENFIKVSRSFGLPILWSEQAPDKIGGTIESVKNLLLPVAQPVAKRSFSCYDVPQYRDQLHATKRRQVLIIGIETHVCVYQTASDLHRHGYEVHVVADAVSSRYQSDRDLALSRMRHEGIITTSAEMAICELLKTADHPKFKEVIAFLKR